ncbi:MAG: hypothetical protein UY48_C0044G0006 [Candidatus Gottesmanbacteria bacterium GW2011_GWB1_49_7]|uniref:Uncharacterized protein n=1 Tax=Candidatus Gottesmanbacteria bacterium GW2011_GWB1_49_7 TaxID=1618448 RepID=A0A0G1Y5S4_9BACT|nr:MAG: hypothetical protein UY48_C0044G0006 [Candidatus Gottesmanbacteria bacterium GW2011_GWB1_49_7]
MGLKDEVAARVEALIVPDLKAAIAEQNEQMKLNQIALAEIEEKNAVQDTKIDTLTIAVSNIKFPDVQFMIDTAIDNITFPDVQGMIDRSIANLAVEQYIDPAELQAAVSNIVFPDVQGMIDTAIENIRFPDVQSMIDSSIANLTIEQYIDPAELQAAVSNIVLPDVQGMIDRSIGGFPTAKTLDVADRGFGAEKWFEIGYKSTISYIPISFSASQTFVTDALGAKVLTISDRGYGSEKWFEMKYQNNNIDIPLNTPAIRAQTDAMLKQAPVFQDLKLKIEDLLATGLDVSQYQDLISGWITDTLSGYQLPTAKILDIADRGFGAEKWFEIGYKSTIGYIPISFSAYQLFVTDALGAKILNIADRGFGDETWFEMKYKSTPIDVPISLSAMRAWAADLLKTVGTKFDAVRTVLTGLKDRFSAIGDAFGLLKDDYDNMRVTIDGVQSAGSPVTEIDKLKAAVYIVKKSISGGTGVHHYNVDLNRSSDTPYSFYGLSAVIDNAKAQMKGAMDDIAAIIPSMALPTF